MEEVDIAIIGAGVIGLAVSYILSDVGKEILVVEKNPSFGQEA
ncbi:MAG: FAD-dependent oxidoreductase, partial [Candidatus Omnitrophota bacterium]